jgi:hypothetical protein
VRDALRRVVSDRHLGLGQQPGEVDEELPGHDERALALDPRGERRAQRQLHVGRGELEQAVLGSKHDAGEHLHGAPRGDRARDDGQTGDELVAITNDVHTGPHGDVCFHDCSSTLS